MRRKIEKEQIKLVTWQSKRSETETVNSNWKSSASQTGVSGWKLNNTPGLRQACLEYPHYLAAYAPQLTIPGFGGDFEKIYDKWLENSRKKQQIEKERKSRSGTALTTNGDVPTCDELLALHDPNFGNYESATIACNFVQGDLMGPPVKVYDTIDYLLWLLSDASAWIPEKARNYLIDGLKKWAVWLWTEYSNDSDFPSNNETGSLQEALSRAETFKAFRITPKINKDIESRFSYTINILDLPESVDEIKKAFLGCGAIQEWFSSRTRRKKKSNKARQTVG